jgi:hypothetical protein
MPAERVGDRADVSTRADADAKSRHSPVIPDHVEPPHGRAPSRHLDLHAAAEELVGPLAPDLDCGGRRDRQIDFSAERLDPHTELLGRGRLLLLDEVTLRVGGRGPPGEVDLRLILLVQAHEPGRLLREGAEEDEQEAGRERVESACMAGTRAGPVAQVAHHGERRRPRRLVDEHEARWSQSAGRH